MKEEEGVGIVILKGEPVVFGKEVEGWGEGMKGGFEVSYKGGYLL